MVRLSLSGSMLVILVLMLQGCYSFSGGSLPPHIRTVAVPSFEERSGAGVAQLGAEFTEKLIDAIEAQSSLVIESDKSRADAVVNAAIVSFSDEPSQIGTDSERAVTNRITIVIRASFIDQVEKKPFFDRTLFNGFDDYAVGDFVGKEEAIDDVVDQIVDDLFNRMISCW
ncbi:MAG: hypothetical protein C1941_02420 [Prosthecochloris sp.]|nr:hypothetical protein [Prosthecochloris sp.]